MKRKAIAQQLQAWTDGQLSEQETASLEQALESHPDLLHTFRETSKTLAVKEPMLDADPGFYDRLKHRMPAAPVRRSSLMQPWLQVVAATVVLLLSIGTGVFAGIQNGTNSEETGMQAFVEEYLPQEQSGQAYNFLLAEMEVQDDWQE